VFAFDLHLHLVFNASERQQSNRHTVNYVLVIILNFQSNRTGSIKNIDRFDVGIQ
jgi:hypothetical protein